MFGSAYSTGVINDGVNESCYAGLMNVDYTDGSLNVHNFNVFCVTVNQNVGFGDSWAVHPEYSDNKQDYNLGSPPPGGNLTLPNSNEVGYLVDRYMNDLLDADHAAGLQLAVWSLVNPSASYVSGFGGANAAKIAYLADLKKKLVKKMKQII